MNVNCESDLFCVFIKVNVNMNRGYKHGVLQCVAVCRSLLQCVAVYMKVNVNMNREYEDGFFVNVNVKYES